VSKDRLESLLQECLSAYDQGLSPEECLSAFPEYRAALEPLLRQALNLRVAFAVAPSEGFREQTRERLLFAAGRETSQAFSAEPDARYVQHARARFLRAAGAPAMEALRDVPPPRLPFWVNARRRLLDAATRPLPRQTPRPAMVAVQRGLSFAVVFLAIAVAGLAYVTSQSNPTSVSAEFAALDQQLKQVEQQVAAGEAVPNAVIVDLSKRTSQLVEKLNDQGTPAPLAVQLPAIIERQKDVVSAAVSEGSPAPELMEAQQELAQTEAKVRILAARVDQPTAEPTTQPQSTTQANPSPTANASASPTATTGPTATPGPLQPGQVSIALVRGDTTFGLTWTEVRTSTIRFLIPSTWTVSGVNMVAGIATLETDLIRIDGVSNGISAIVLVNTRSGEVNAIVDGKPLLLRSEGPNGQAISVATLVEQTGPASPAIFRLVGSIELFGSLATPTTAPATPTRTPSP
jgi:hypothetical protein